MIGREKETEIERQSVRKTRKSKTEREGQREMDWYRKIHSERNRQSMQQKLMKRNDNDRDIDVAKKRAGETDRE